MRIWPWLAALILAACGGSAPNSPGNAPRPFKSLLVPFEAGSLIDGLELVDATQYWTHAEAKNGNAFPIRASVDNADMLIVRAMPGGELQVRGSDAFEAVDLAGLRARIEPLVKRTLQEDQSAASCGVVLLAHADAPAELLTRLCFTCVNMKVGNLWMATHDSRDGACRLLNVRLDPQRGHDPWYGAMPEVADAVDTGPCARLEWEGGLPVLRMAKGRRLAVKDLPNWGKALTQTVATQSARPRHLQLVLARGESMRAFGSILAELAPAGFAQIEPLWPLAEAEDLPDASRYWGASQSARVELAQPDEPATLFVRLSGDGKLAWLEGMTWHEADTAGLRARVQTLADATRDAATGHAAARVAVVAGTAAPWRGLLTISKACVDAKLPGLHLCTRERGTTAARLLPLKADVIQAGAEKYGVAEDAQSDVVEMNWTGELPRFHFGDGKGYGVDELKDWPQALRRLVDARTPRPGRLIVLLDPAATLDRFESTINEPVTARFTAIEPCWANLAQESKPE